MVAILLKISWRIPQILILGINPAFFLAYFSAGVVHEVLHRKKVKKIAEESK